MKKTKIKSKIQSNKIFFMDIKPTKENIYHKKSVKASKYYAKWQNKK